jgi:hypothetical protein
LKDQKIKILKDLKIKKLLLTNPNLPTLIDSRLRPEKSPSNRDRSGQAGKGPKP